jgi:hypothetical protein
MKDIITVSTTLLVYKRVSRRGVWDRRTVEQYRTFVLDGDVDMSGVIILYFSSFSLIVL